MSYKVIDSIILEWAVSHALLLCTRYKDEEVRSVDIVAADGRKCQVWIDVPDSKGNVKVNVWNYHKKRDMLETTISELARCLEDAYVIARKWLATA